ncbi:hypothetical protein G4V62_00775 [Bacillaceae bacterium SIJ1]|uniref:hypothetical protein n=1 Tax=Litoribacterium kuwaitense TaxID=1398745 RepID=UPI0013EAB88C|nr:hypothetical protein [Litoribacterium kuwaitense]NGP43565.1 hypothetical protein [Litoribacterium kuwaitense]
MNVKASVNIAFFCLLLVLLALAPLFIAEIKNKRLLNAVYTETLDDKKYVSSENIEVSTKIATIQSAVSNTRGIVTWNEQVSDVRDEDIARTVIEELKKLQKVKVIPSRIDFSSKYAIERLIKKDFIDVNNPQIKVDIQEVRLAFDDYSIVVWMDDEADLIYQFEIYSKEHSVITKETPAVQAYMDYLGLPSDHIQHKSGSSGRFGYYQYSNEEVDLSYLYVQEKHYFAVQIDKANSLYFNYDPEDYQLIQAENESLVSLTDHERRVIYLSWEHTPNQDMYTAAKALKTFKESFEGVTASIVKSDLNIPSIRLNDFNKEDQSTTSTYFIDDNEGGVYQVFVNTMALDRSDQENLLKSLEIVPKAENENLDEITIVEPFLG